MEVEKIIGRIEYENLLPEHHEMIKVILATDFGIEAMKDNTIHSVTVGRDGIAITWITNKDNN